MSLAQFPWTTRARPVVEVGVGDSRIAGHGALWNVARWDDPDALWAGVEPFWHDVTCDTFAARCTYGRERTTDRFIPGTATVVVDNTSGWADPHGTDDSTTLTMRPGRPVRFGVDHDDYGLRWLFHGFIDSISPTYDPVDTDTVELVCVDALGEVGRAKWATNLAPSEYAHERFARTLDLAKWPATKRRVDASSFLVIPADLAGQAADVLGRTADSAGGVVFGDGDGNVAFRMKDWQTYIPGTPPDATIGNVQAGPDPVELHDAGAPIVFDGATVIFGAVEGAGDVCPTGWVRPFERADIATRVIVGRDVATAYVIDDEPAQHLYGVEPFERTDLWTAEDTRLYDLGERMLATRSSSTAPRIRSVSFDARTSPDALDLMATVDVYKPSRYRCRLRYPRGDIFDAEHFATGVAHELTPNAWTLDLNLDLAAPYAVAGGRWSEDSHWNESTWATA